MQKILPFWLSQIWWTIRELPNTSSYIIRHYAMRSLVLQGNFLQVLMMTKYSLSSPEVGENGSIELTVLFVS